MKKSAVDRAIEGLEAKGAAIDAQRAAVDQAIAALKAAQAAGKPRPRQLPGSPVVIGGKKP